MIKNHPEKQYSLKVSGFDEDIMPKSFGELIALIRQNLSLMEVVGITTLMATMTGGINLIKGNELDEVCLAAKNQALYTVSVGTVLVVPY